MPRPACMLADIHRPAQGVQELQKLWLYMAVGRLQQTTRTQTLTLLLTAVGRLQQTRTQTLLSMAVQCLQQTTTTQTLTLLLWLYDVCKK